MQRHVYHLAHCLAHSKGSVHLFLITDIPSAIAYTFAVPMVTTGGPTQLSPGSEADTIPGLSCSGPWRSPAIPLGSLGRQSHRSPW